MVGNFEDIWRNLICNAIFLAPDWGNTEIICQLCNILEHHICNGILHRPVDGLFSYLSHQDKISLTSLWLRQHPTFVSLADLFNVTVAYTQRVVMHILCLLHEQLVPQEVVWHSPQRWLQFRESFDAYPDVVGIMDSTPIWINRPTGRLQRFLLQE